MIGEHDEVSGQPMSLVTLQGDLEGDVFAVFPRVSIKVAIRRPPPPHPTRGAGPHSASGLVWKQAAIFSSVSAGGKDGPGEIV